MRIGDLMTRNVATVRPDSSVSEAAKLMSQHNVGSIPVCEGNRIVGILTDRDITLRNVAAGANPDQTKVRDIMSTDLVTGNPQMDIHEAAHIMAQRQIRRLPVVENGNLVGIVAIGDIAVEPKFGDEAGEALSNISKPASPKM